MKLLFAVLLSSIAGFIYQLRASRRDVEKFPPLGKLVKTAHGDIHLHCQGQGDVTVILEAGLGDSSLEWSIVRPMVAQFARVCTYDRVGLGWSSPATDKVTPQTVVENLYQALKGADVAGPYVLVGHSVGGVYVRAFAQQYPEDVAGLVFIDSAHENQQAHLPAEAMKEDMMVKAFASVFRVLAPLGIPRAFKLADRMQGDDFPAMSSKPRCL